MGLLDLFRRGPKDEVHGTRSLVCSLSPEFDDLLKTDSSTYSRFYRATTTYVFSSIPELLDLPPAAEMKSREPSLFNGAAKLTSSYFG